MALGGQRQRELAGPAHIRERAALEELAGTVERARLEGGVVRAALRALEERVARVAPAGLRVSNERVVVVAPAGLVVPVELRAREGLVELAARAGPGELRARVARAGRVARVEPVELVGLVESVEQAGQSSMTHWHR